MLVSEKMKKKKRVREEKADLETKDTKRATQIKTNIVTGKNITFLLYLLSLKLSLNVRKPIFHWKQNGGSTNRLLTDCEGRTGEYWPEVVAVRTERREVRTTMTEGQYSPVRPE